MAEAAVDLFAQKSAGGRLKERQQSARRGRNVRAANDASAPASIGSSQNFGAANDGSYQNAGAQLARNTQDARRQANQAFQPVPLRNTPQQSVGGAQTRPQSSGQAAAQFTQSQQQRRRALRGNVRKSLNAVKKDLKNIAKAIKGAPDMLGEAARGWMDRVTPGLIMGFKLIVPPIAAIFLLFVRTLGSLAKDNPLIPFLGQLRFEDTSMIEAAAPDSKTMRPPRFNLLTGVMTMMFLAGVVACALMIIVMAVVLPMAILYIVANDPLMVLEFGSSSMFSLFKPLIDPVLNFLNPFS